MKLNGRLVINWRGIRGSFGIMRNPNISTVGISSRTLDHKHIIGLDYDQVSVTVLVEELHILLDEFKLSPFYLFSSSKVKKDRYGSMYGNWHAISLTKRSLKEVVKIHDRSCCDVGHSGIIFNSIHKSWVLRQFPKMMGKEKIADKPRFVDVIGNSGFNNETSSGHLIYLMKHYEIPELPYQRMDGHTKIWESPYEYRKA